MGLLSIFHVHFALHKRTSPSTMKTMARILLITVLPMAAFAWAPYEASTVPPMENYEQSSQTMAAYDPAVVPLDYYDAVESEQQQPAEPMPLDAD